MTPSQPSFDPTAGWRDVNARIAAAATAHGRDPSDVSLIAVSKQQPWPSIAPILAAGQRRFGENRVQEAQKRWSVVDQDRAGLELRLIGPLQSNKVEDAILLFDVIETLDRPSLAVALAKAMQKLAKSPRLYVQVNVGEEPQKAGVRPAEADAFIATVRRDQGFTIEGLMCIPPADEPPGPYFALLRKIATRNGVEKLSMGMSGDFETAIRFGATSVRVGSAVFGRRELPRGQ